MKRGVNILLGFITWTLFLSLPITAQIPEVKEGELVRLEGFESRYVSARNVDVWLPAGYADSIEYAVLYLHDGQMLYDAQTTWNGQSWDVDDVASQLQHDGKCWPFIVVGVWNGGEERHADYFPQQPFEALNQQGKDFVSSQLREAGRIQGDFQPQSDAYLKFLVEELKPYIDDHFSVHTGRTHTFIAGSSMGGLISIYALCEYPEVFGGAACLSTHWPGVFTLDNNPIPKAFIQYLKKKLPNPGQHRIYFDCGDQTLDAMYPQIQKKVDRVLAKRGYSASYWMTRYFPGEDHSENAWRNRLAIPLSFLLQ